MFFRNVSIHIEDYTFSQHERQLNIIIALSSSDRGLCHKQFPGIENYIFTQQVVPIVSPAENCIRLSLCSLTNEEHKEVHECLGTVPCSTTHVSNSSYITLRNPPIWGGGSRCKEANELWVNKYCIKERNHVWIRIYGSVKFADVVEVGWTFLFKSQSQFPDHLSECSQSPSIIRNDEQQMLLHRFIIHPSLGNESPSQEIV
jgi:hypothetical protein